MNWFIDILLAGNSREDGRIVHYLRVDADQHRVDLTSVVSDLRDQRFQVIDRNRNRPLAAGASEHARIAVEVVDNKPPARGLVCFSGNRDACEVQHERGPIKKGLAADFIAVTTNPLEDIDALRDVQFVMKDGQVFKRDGIVMPMDFFHGGPKYGWRVR